MKSLLVVPVAVAAILAWTTHTPETPIQEAPVWLHFDLEDVRAERAEHGRPWQEFIRVPDLFTGIYEIPAGGEDPQGPHGADEVYHILSGRATLLVEDDSIEVSPGSVVYVVKDTDHRFVDVVEDLSVLVFFATPGGGEDEG